MLFPETETMLGHTILEDDDMHERSNSPQNGKEEKLTHDVQANDADV